jgi:hypothetical protein
MTEIPNMRYGVPPVRKRFRQVSRFAAVLVLAAASLGCGKPVPPDKIEYVGEWSSPEMYLLITADGSVRYQRLKGGMETSITGPLRGFEGNDFIVGLPLLSATFDVSTPPYEENGTWKIVVDGVLLERSR